ncbi:MAG TPA: helix-turn-helix transcriptional regulator [Pseudonocardiaceae bacterium]|nr:helix-turn-helix transcriptional regulator [Pseudonocardiaceae bacterium]
MRASHAHIQEVARSVETFGDTLRRLRTQVGLKQGDLAKQANWSQSQISRAEQNSFLPDEGTVERLDGALNANGQLIAAYATTKTPELTLLQPGRDPLVFSDLIRKIHRTDVGRDTIDQLNVITEQLCCEYVSRPADELRADAHHQLEYVQQLLQGPTRLVEHRELLVIAGWLSLLIGCLNYDLGLARHAETARTAAFQLGREAGHGEIVAWSFEMSAWFALTQGRLRSVPDYVDAGINAAPHASVAVQLAAQAAKAHARMGNPSDVRRALDHGARLLGEHEHPSRPDNHFVIDPTKWDFYAMDCYRIAGDNPRASENAQEILRLSARPDGTDRSPMRASEARLTLSIVSLRDDDIDNATDWAHKAFSTDRRSINSLSTVVDELYHEARAQYGDDPAISALNNVIASFYASISHK